jgi:hypothetical protein
LKFVVFNLLFSIVIASLQRDFVECGTHSNLAEEIVTMSIIGVYILYVIMLFYVVCAGGSRCLKCERVGGPFS